jgi:hypothetical protein
MSDAKWKFYRKAWWDKISDEPSKTRESVRTATGSWNILIDTDSWFVAANKWTPDLDLLIMWDPDAA